MGTSKVVTEQNISRMGDALAYGGILGTIVGYLPAIAAGLSIIWIAIQITQAITGVKFHELIKCVWKRFFP